MTALVPLHPDQGGDWRLVDAGALDARAAKLDVCLREMEEAHAIFESQGDHAAAAELRATAATVRSRATDYRDRAKALRADARDSPRPELVRAITTR